MSNIAPVATISGQVQPVGSEILVNSATVGQQFQEKITTLANGNFVVTWQDGGHGPDLSSTGRLGSLGVGGATGDTSDGAIKAQMFTTGGSPVGGEFLVNTTVLNAQDYPAITALADGGFVVTWTDLSKDVYPNQEIDIKAQVYGADGAQVGSEIAVNTTEGGLQIDSHITALADGGFVVTWWSIQGNVFAQKFSTAGTAVGPEILVDGSGTNGSGQSPDVVALQTGGFAVTWHGSGPANTQVYDAGGAAAGGVITDPGFVTEHIAALDTGGFVKVDGASSGQMTAQIFSDAGVAAGAPISIPGSDPNSVLGPQVAALPNGHFVVSWEQPQSSSIVAIEAQIFDADGTAVTGPFGVSTPPSSTPNSNTQEKIAVLSNGDFVIAWNDPTFDGDGTTIEARAFNADGTPLGDQFAASTSITFHTDPQIVAQPNGGFVVTWTDRGPATLGAHGDDSLAAIKAQVFNLGYVAAEGVALNLRDTGLSIDDPDGNQSTETVTLSVSEGILNVSSGIVGTVVSGSGTGSVTITGTIYVLNAVLNTDPNIYPQTASVSFVDPSDAPASHVTLTLAIDDNAGGTATASTTIQILPVNDPPVNTAPELVVTPQNADHAVAGLSISDPDSPSMMTTLHVDHGTLSVAATGGATVSGSGTSDVTLTGTLAQIDVALSATNGVIYQGASSFFGIDHLVMTSNDGGSFAVGGPLIATSTTLINVTPGDTAPVITSNGGGSTASISVVEHGTAVTTVQAIDVDGDVVTYAIVGGDDHSDFQIDATTGALTFVTAPDFGTPADADHNNGYIVEVAASDGNLAADQTLTVNVTNLPAVVANDAFTVAENATLSGHTVFADNGSGADSGFGFAVTAVDGFTAAVGSEITLGSGAHLTLSADGTFTYDPHHAFDSLAAGATGTDSFNYTVTGGSTAVATVTVIGIDNAPAAQDGSAGGSENTAITGTVAATDIDNTQGQLTFGLVGINGGAQHGAVTVNPDGTFSYTPSVNYNGPDSFTFKANDGSLDSNTATENLTITHVNVAPVAQDGSVSGNEDTVITGVVAATDIDNVPTELTYSLIGTNGGAQHGAVTLHADGTFSYTPSVNYNGPDSFSFKANDGSLDSSAATEAITVDPVNDAPVITSNGGGSTASVSVAEHSTAVTTVQANDVDGDVLTYAIVGGDDHADFQIDATTGALTFVTAPDFGTPADADHNNSYIVEVAASDGNLAADQTLTVNVTNLPAIAANDAFTVAENATLSGHNVFADNGSGDDNGSGFAVTAVDGFTAAVGSEITLGSGAHLTLSADGTFTYDPHHAFDSLAAGAAGTDSFNYTVTGGSTAVATVTVTGVDSAPAGADKTVTTLEDTGYTFAAADFGFSDAGESPPNSLLAVKITTLPAAGALTVNSMAVTAGQFVSATDITDGHLVYTPAANANGAAAASFTFQVQDNGGTANGGVDLDPSPNMLTINLTAVDDAPVATGGGVSGNEDTVISGTVPTASDVDNTPGQLSYALVGTNGGAAHGTVALNANGSFSYTPFADFNGGDSFSFQANDGALDSNVATESLVIAAVNDAPVIASNGGGDAAIVAVAENATVVTTVHATDIDSPTLTYAISGGADQVLFHIDAASGLLTFAAAPDFEAPADANHDNSYIVQVSASDGSLADNQTLTVSVTNVPDVVNTDSSFNGDLGGDHKSDLIIRDVTGGVTLWQMNGGHIQLQQSVGSVGNDWHIESNADFGGDGKADILWHADDGSVAIWQMNGARITANTGLGKVGNEWHINGTGDFNGDGKADILWQADDGSVAIWQMNGNQIAASQAVGTVSPEQHVVGIGDFNGDHESDILWRADDGTLALWQMNGAQVQSNQNLGKVGPEQHVEGVGDFNGDGQADILFRADDGTLTLWQMNNGHVQSSQVIGTVGPEWHVSGTADLNGDGQADILLRNTDGSFAAWEMDAVHIAAQDTIAPLPIDATLGAHHYDLI